VTASPNRGVLFDVVSVVFVAACCTVTDNGVEALAEPAAENCLF
jgi:hypothetical protein